MRKRIFTAVAVTLLVAGGAVAQVSGTAHDLSGQGTNPTNEVCVFCHTPHGASPSVPLWNHTLSTQAYTEYTSPTMDSTSVGPLQGGTGVSNLCLSCHDGSVALSSLVNNPPTGDPGIGVMGAVNANLGTDLSNDHPVNIIYDEAVDAELVARATVLLTLDLFGAGANELQCASCHDPHNDSNNPFLVISNAGSALCTTCHIK